MRIRAAREIADYFREIDPSTDISETLIRRLMDEGEVPTFKNGVKKLTSIEAVEEYFYNKLSVK